MNSDKNWVLQVDPAVYKFLDKIPRDDAERILFIIECLVNDPFVGDIQKMRGEDNVWRRRIGVYRIRFEIVKQEKVIHVFCAERRTSKTINFIESLNALWSCYGVTAGAVRA